jgi:hypothetical protein
MHAFIDSLGHPVLDLVYVAFYQRNPIDHLSVLSLLHRHRHNVLLRICLHHFDKVLTVECYVTLFIRVVVLVDVSTTVGVVIWIRISFVIASIKISSVQLLNTTFIMVFCLLCLSRRWAVIGLMLIEFEHGRIWKLFGFLDRRALRNAPLLSCTWLFRLVTDFVVGLYLCWEIVSTRVTVELAAVGFSLTNLLLYRNFINWSWRLWVLTLVLCLLDHLLEWYLVLFLLSLVRIVRQVHHVLYIFLSRSHFWLLDRCTGTCWSLLNLFLNTVLHCVLGFSC